MIIRITKEAATSPLPRSPPNRYLHQPPQVPRNLGRHRRRRLPRTRRGFGLTRRSHPPGRRSPTPGKRSPPTTTSTSSGSARRTPPGTPTPSSRSRGRLRSTASATSLATTRLEDFVHPSTIEDRIYRFRCVEAWSMVIPVAGVPPRGRHQPGRAPAQARSTSPSRRCGTPGQMPERRWRPRDRLALPGRDCGWTRPFIPCRSW